VLGFTKYRFYFTILAFCFINALKTTAQTLKWLVDGDANAAKAELVNLEKRANSIFDANQKVNAAVLQFQTLGYLAAGVDSISNDAENFTAHIHLGNKYDWQKIKLQVLPVGDAAMAKNLFDEAKTGLLNTQRYNALCNKILDYYEQHGYPFVQIYLDSISFDNNNINAKLVVDKGQLVRFDSISVEGEAEVSEKFISQHIGIKAGDVYDERLLNDLSRKLRELNFVVEEKPWIMRFSHKQSILSIYLNERNANSADVLIGLAPSNTTFGNRFFLTGDAKLKLVNSLRNGETILLNWQNLQQKSPRLKLETTLPYVAGTAFGANAKFEYIKQDSSFSTVNYELGVLYHVTLKSVAKVYFTNFTSSLIQIDSQFIKLQRRLPLNVDYGIRSYGMQWTYSFLNNQLNPTKGVYFMVDGNAGSRKIKRNRDIEKIYDPVKQESFAYLYDTTTKNTLRIWLQSNAAYYAPLFNRLSLKTSAQVGYVRINNLLRNDMFQIGGYRTLRGFDEASLFTNQYAIGTVEPRFSLNKTSYVFGLLDAGVVNLPLANITNKKVLGFGAGLSLATRNGLFNMIYAFGNNSNEGIQFRNSKIHFGYVNSF
jgi:outer membrane protein assembly factor BamA